MSFLSQLRSRGRHDKASLVERIDRFEGDIKQADGKVTRCELNLQRAQGEFADEIEWGARHGWRAERLDAIEAELSNIRGRTGLPERGGSGQDRRAAVCDRRSPPIWERQLGEIAAPRLPDPGHGIDIGL